MTSHPHPNPPPSRGRETRKARGFPSPLAGEGKGGGDAQMNVYDLSPPPQPSPVKGEGDARGNRGAVLLDRDGVINRRRSGHVRSWAEFEFLPGVLPALRELERCGVRVVVITNQSVVG